MALKEVFDWLRMDSEQRGRPQRVAPTASNDSQQRGNDRRPGEALNYEGKFVPLVDTADASVPLTTDDLDAMGSNFQPKTIADHIPVRFGRANGDGPIVARINSLKRDGAVLSGKLINVDPRADQLLTSKKLGGRTARSLRFERAPDSGGVSLTGYGYMPPKIYTSGAFHDGENTDDALTKLARADSSGEILQFSAADAGKVEFIVSEVPRKFRFASNSEKLSDLAYAHASEENVSFGEALSRVATENPSLTRENRPAPAEEAQSRVATENLEGWRLQRNSERLSDLAEQRAEQAGISFGEALAQVAAEHRELTLPDSVIVFAEERPKSHSEQLSDLAYARAREKRITFGEALSQVAVKHPELTRG